MKVKKKFEWGYLLLIPGLGFIAFFLVTAIGMMILQSIGFLNFTGESSFSLDTYFTKVDCFRLSRRMDLIGPS